MSDFTWRQIIVFVIGMALATLVTIWLTNVAVQRFIVGDRDDPLARAGGLKPSQKIR
jgi:hypothetical protein